jgi:hypothetical protein
MPFVFDDGLRRKTGDESSTVVRIHGVDEAGEERILLDFHGDLKGKICAYV